jgi:hypothetical protein
MSFCIILTKSSRVMRALALIFLTSLLLAGCTTVTYKSNLTAIVAKPAGYPIPIYVQEENVPRPCIVIGTISIHPGDFTMFGGSSEAEIKKVMQKAYEQGADAVKLTAVEKPDFTNPNYRLTAELLRYTDIWESVTISNNKFQTYLDANRPNLDPIEGAWFSDGPNPHLIGIMKNNSKPGRDFIGFILDSKNPDWPTGFKKIEIRRGPQPGSYVITYYLDDFAPREIPIILGRKKTFSVVIQKSDDEENVNVITYVKNQY